MVTMGARQSLGLFVSPLNTSTGLGIVTISFAMAVAQFVWGAVQPIAGAMADRYGPARVLAGGLIVLAIGSALTPFMTSWVRPGICDRHSVGGRGRRCELFSADRSGLATRTGEQARHRVRRNQCRRFVRSVCVCAAAAETDQLCSVGPARCGRSPC